MNNKVRSTRAVVAVMLLVMAGFLFADALGNYRAGAEYNYELSVLIVAIAVGTSVALFLWNVTEMLIYKNRARRMA